MAKLAHYADMLRGLLPRGTIWAAPPQSKLYALLYACAAELTRLDGETQRFIAEADPQSSSEAVEDWERMLGLPDACGSDADTLQQRREQVLQKLVRPVGQDAAFFALLAASLGYADAKVSTFPPFCVDASGAEDRLNDALGGVVLNYSTTPPTLTQDMSNGWRFVWLLTVGSGTITCFGVDASGADDRLAQWGNERLECIINRAKPAHTKVLFGYAKNGE
jgi:uncharacterized protein YmfQ (DUF2313 family)